MTPRLAALWAIAVAAILLLVASLAGSGQGIGGWSPMSHMAWSYALLLLFAGVIAWAMRPTTRRQG